MVGMGRFELPSIPCRGIHLTVDYTCPKKWRKFHDKIRNLYKYHNFGVTTATIMSIIDINIDTLRQIVPLVYSWAALARTFELISRERVKRLCKEHQIDTSHFTGSKRTPGIVRVGKNAMTLTEYLSLRQPRGGEQLRKRLVTEGLKKNCCERCGLTKWQGEPIPLETHHIDGDRLNNTIENLQILCCNCHALTPNYKSLNQKRRTSRITVEQYREAIECSESLMDACRKLGISPQGGNLVTLKRVCKTHGFKLKNSKEEVVIPAELLAKRWKEVEAKVKIKPDPKPRPVSKMPPKEELEKLIWEKPQIDIGKQFGVNSNTVKFWCEKLDIKTPPQGYWVRRHAGFNHEESLVHQKRRRTPLRRPTEEQALTAFNVFQRTGTMRRAAEAIGFNHEVVRDALIRFGMLPEDYNAYEYRKATEKARIELSTGV
jgi:hypothetical protein